MGYLYLLVVCSDEARARMNKEYLSDPNYNYESVNRASKACGPLVKWAIAQVSCTHVTIASVTVTDLLATQLGIVVATQIFMHLYIV